MRCGSLLGTTDLVGCLYAKYTNINIRNTETAVSARLNNEVDVYPGGSIRWLLPKRETSPN